MPLTNVFISQLVSQSDPLRLVLDRLAVHDGRFKLLRNTPVNSVTLRIGWNVSVGLFLLPGWTERLVSPTNTYEVFYCAPIASQNYGCCVVWCFTLRLGVHPLELQLIPHDLHQLVHVPAMLGTDGHGMRDAVQQVEFLNADGIDLVETVHHGNVA